LKRLGGRGVDVVTVFHRVVAVVWIASAAAALLLSLSAFHTPVLGIGRTWQWIDALQAVAAYSSFPMIAIGVVYGVATQWGFGVLRHRLVLLKWVLLLAATGFGGPSISAAKTHSASVVVVLTVLELASLIGAVVLGVSLRRSRRSRSAVSRAD
jgi:hypothetical protein